MSQNNTNSTKSPGLFVFIIILFIITFMASIAALAPLFSNPALAAIVISVISIFFVAAFIIIAVFFFGIAKNYPQYLKKMAKLLGAKFSGGEIVRITGTYEDFPFDIICGKSTLETPIPQGRRIPPVMKIVNEYNKKLVYTCKDRRFLSGVLSGEIKGILKDQAHSIRKVIVEHDTVNAKLIFKFEYPLYDSYTRTKNSIRALLTVARRLYTLVTAENLEKTMLNIIFSCEDTRQRLKDITQFLIHHYDGFDLPLLADMAKKCGDSDITSLFLLIIEKSSPDKLLMAELSEYGKECYIDILEKMADTNVPGFQAMYEITKDYDRKNRLLSIFRDREIPGIQDFIISRIDAYKGSFPVTHKKLIEALRLNGDMKAVNFLESHLEENPNIPEFHAQVCRGVIKDIIQRRGRDNLIGNLSISNDSDSGKVSLVTDN